MGNNQYLSLEVAEAVKVFGTRVRTARIRRRMSQDDLAQACQISRKTLYALESGVPGVSIATAFTALWVLGLLESVKGLADPDADEHGKILETARQPKRIRRDSHDANDF